MNNEPAFPVGIPADANSKHPKYIQVGMTIRQWFAGQALIGLLHRDGYNKWEYLANDAYAVADAMLAERAKKQEY